MKRVALAGALFLLAGGASAQETTFEKDAQGRIAVITTAEGATRYTYFEDGLIESVEHPDGIKETYTHGELLGPAAATSSPVASTNRFAFTGYLWDTETGLYYAKARYYDPETGRFITQDSHLGDISDPPSLHRYMYGHDNPTRYIDPTGHSDADANRLAAAMHKRTGFLAADHRPAHQRGWWYNFGKEVYVDLPPRLIPMEQFEGLATQDAEQFAKGTGETVVASVVPPVVRKGAGALVARFPWLGQSVTEAAGGAFRRLRAPAPPAELPGHPVETVTVSESSRSSGGFVNTEDGRQVPLQRVAGGSQAADTAPSPSSVENTTWARSGVLSDEAVSWTATRVKGTHQTYHVYQRNDVDWSLLRTAGDKRFVGKTNAEARDRTRARARGRRFRDPASSRAKRPRPARRGQHALSRSRQDRPAGPSLAIRRQPAESGQPRKPAAVWRRYPGVLAVARRSGQRMMQSNLHEVRERYARLFGSEGVEDGAYESIEAILGVRLPEDLKQISPFFSGGLLGGISHHAIAAHGPATNVVDETTRLRETVSLPHHYIVLAEPPDSLIVLKTVGGPGGTTPVIWCSSFDVARLADVESLTKPDIWPDYASFFRHLLDEEEAERHTAG